MNTDEAYQRMWQLQGALEKYKGVGAVVSLPTLLSEGDRTPFSFLISYEHMMRIMEEPQHSRVADSLYWMSRYFERADHCARVLDAGYNLMLNPSKASTEQRWHRITARLGLASESAGVDPQTAMLRLLCETANRSSIVSCKGVTA